MFDGRGDKTDGKLNLEGKSKKKRGAQETGTTGAFKRLSVTKLMGSLIPSSCCSFTHSCYTLGRAALASVLNGKGRHRERGQRRANILLSVTPEEHQSVFIWFTTVCGAAVTPECEIIFGRLEKIFIQRQLVSL